MTTTREQYARDAKRYLQPARLQFQTRALANGKGWEIQGDRVVHKASGISFPLVK